MKINNRIKKSYKMKKIEDLIKNNEKYKNTIIQKKFTSKKNTVCYVFLNNKPRVLKWFAPGFRKNMETEYTILKKGSSKINIPTPLDNDKKNNVIVMSYIIGENLSDVINDEKITILEKQRLMYLLAEWFYKFHTYFRRVDKVCIRGDSILRNFILTDRLWGVDFEESRYGKTIEDIAVMCASILSTYPMFTDGKLQLIRNFINSYEKLTHQKFHDIHNDIAYSLLEKIQWRPNDEKIIRTFSQKIRKKGI
jgi:tRNA A-37 threonylcarbamoyl transferase component Bud32